MTADRSGHAGGGRFNARLVVAAGVLLAMLACALLAVVTQRLANRNATATTKVQDQIVTAASQTISAALSYDYRRLPANFAAAEKGLTPSFRAVYQHDASTAVTPVATKYHAVTSASVVKAGVLSNTRKSATLLVFIDQTSSNTQLSAPRLDRSRAQVTMTKVGDRWLLNSITTL